MSKFAGSEAPKMNKDQNRIEEARGCDILRRFCIEGIRANEDRCRQHVESSTATVTALVPAIGYDRATRLAKLAVERKKTIREVTLGEGMLTFQQFEELVSPEAIRRSGSPFFQRETE
jgi:aspartate ammonia-lyase